MKFLYAAVVAILLAGGALAQPVPAFTQCVTTALAGGTGDAITIPRLPCVPTTTLLTLVITSANTTSTPTLQPQGAPAQVIVNADGSAVAVGALKVGLYTMMQSNGQKWFWITGGVAGPPGTPGIPEAPSDGGIYGRGLAFGAMTWERVLPIGGYILPGPFILQGSFCCAVTAGNVPGDFGGNYALGGITVTGDLGTNTMAASGLIAWDVNHTFGGSSAGDGSRIGIWSNLNQVGSLPAGGTHTFHTGIFSNVNANYSLGGNRGALYGFAAQVEQGPGVTDGTYGITGGEIDVALDSPANMVEGWGIASVPLSHGNPTTHGTQYDAGLGIWSGGSCGAGTHGGGGGCIGFDIGISFGRFDSYFPIDTHGTLIGVTKGISTGTLKADWGIRFVAEDGVTAVQFTDCAFASAGVCIDGNGNYKMNAPFPQIVFKDSNVTNPNTNNGLMRLASLGVSGGTNTFQFQVNTASAGDFSTSTAVFGFDATGLFMASPLFLQTNTPATSTTPCGVGEFTVDATYIYTCVAANQWHRVANGATW